MYQTLKELFICQHESFDTFGIFHNVSEIYIYGYKFGSSEQRYRPLLLRIFESEENNCTLRKLLLLGCHCITNGFTIYKKRFLLRSIFFKGTVSQDYVFFLFDQKNSRTRAPLWTGKNGFANFFGFLHDICKKRVSAQLLTTPTLCQRSHQLCWHTAN